jgi:hypothetical protein
MLAPKSLRKPSNWQDFESLCKKLWGEIWNCPEIKKNGRSGQVQLGVDIYGVPAGKSRYSAIQCKAKDEDINARLTEASVDAEIEQAKRFEPALEKLYLTTTANKDVRIETYVRKKDIESREQGGFEIHLFSWEDIVELIDENRTTHDWYVQAQGFRNVHSIKVSLMSDINLPVVLKKHKKITLYSTKPEPDYLIPNALRQVFAKQKMMSRILAPVSVLGEMHQNLVNLSFINFSIQVQNLGNFPITHFKILVDLQGTAGELKYGKVYKRPVPNFSKSSFSIRSNSARHWELVPGKDTLVPLDIYSFKSFSFRPENETGMLEIRWQFLSSEFQTHGTIEIPFITELITDHERILVNEPEKEKREEMIEDYFEAELSEDE